MKVSGLNCKPRAKSKSIREALFFNRLQKAKAIPEHPGCPKAKSIRPGFGSGWQQRLRRRDTIGFARPAVEQGTFCSLQGFK